MHKYILFPNVICRLNILYDAVHDIQDVMVYFNISGMIDKTALSWKSQASSRSC